VVVSSLRVTIPVARRLSRRRRTRQRPCILLQRKPSGFSRSVRLKATPYLPPLCVPHHDKHHSRITVLYERLRYRTLGIPARDTIHYHKVGNARVAGKHKATGPQAGGRLLRWRPNGGISKGRRPSRGMVRGPWPAAGRGLPGLPRCACADPQAAALRAGDSPPRPSPFPLLPPVSPTGRVAAAAASPSPKEKRP
jgi:hypothetical protein